MEKSSQEILPKYKTQYSVLEPIYKVKADLITAYIAVIGECIVTEHVVRIR